jgi:hypothetical protein
MACLLLASAVTVGCSQRPSTVVVSVCDISKDFSAYRDKFVAVRGVYYYGLRQKCPQTCATGPWPSSIDLIGSATGRDPWADLDNVRRMVELEAKKGKRFEIWVTAVGQLKTHARRSFLGPCDEIGSRYSGYGHLGSFPAQLVVKHFINIQVKENPNSPTNAYPFRNHSQ